MAGLTGNTVFLATLLDEEVVYIDKMETFNSLRKYSIIGRRATLTSVAALLRDMARIRRRGWSIDDEEYEPGIRCIGAAIRDHRGQVIAAVSTSGSVAMIPRQKVDEVGAQVGKMALEISRRMGYRGQ